MQEFDRAHLFRSVQVASDKFGLQAWKERGVWSVGRCQCHTVESRAKQADFGP